MGGSDPKPISGELLQVVCEFAREVRWYLSDAAGELEDIQEKMRFLERELNNASRFMEKVATLLPEVEDEDADEDG